MISVPLIVAINSQSPRETLTQLEEARRTPSDNTPRSLLLLHQRIPGSVLRWEYSEHGVS